MRIIQSKTQSYLDIRRRQKSGRKVNNVRREKEIEGERECGLS